MKVEIVHDYIKDYGGAERVLEALHETYPDAPVYTTVYFSKYLGPHRSRFESWNIKTSWAQYIPFSAKLISPMRLISPILFKSLDFSGYDVIISSATGAFLPNSLNKKGAKLICYCHTPPKHLYGYETARNWRSNKFESIIGAVAVHFLRIWDFNYSKNVDFYISNSLEIKARIEKFYRKDATVIYPPVDGPTKPNIKQRREYFVTGGRLARAKHPDLILEAFAKNGKPFKIFGKEFAGFGQDLKEKYSKYPNIEFLGEVSDEDKFEILEKAKAFIFAAKDEDFGISPVEAMMSGAPVISYRSGGPIETVIEGKTGIFFDEFNIDSLNSAIDNFGKSKFDNAEIAKYAQKFNKVRFEREIKEFVRKHA